MQIVVRHKRTRDQKFRVQDRFVGLFEHVRGKRKNMMDDDLPGDRSVPASEIIATIPGDDAVADRIPFAGMIEPLVHPPLMTEGLAPNGVWDLQISEPTLEVRDPHESRVASIH